MLPIIIAATGIIASILGTFLVRTPEGATMGRLLWALRTGIFGAGVLVLIGAGIAITALDLPFKLFWVIVVGLAAGQIIGDWDSAALVRGVDEFGNFEPTPSPATDFDPAVAAFHEKASDALREIFYHDAAQITNRL